MTLLCNVLLLSLHFLLFLPRKPSSHQLLVYELREPRRVDLEGGPIVPSSCFHDQRDSWLCSLSLSLPRVTSRYYLRRENRGKSIMSQNFIDRIYVSFKLPRNEEFRAVRISTLARLSDAINSFFFFLFTFFAAPT